MTLSSINHPSERAGITQKPLRAFPDWLSISYPASVSPLNDILDVFGQVSAYTSTPKGRDKTLYRFPAGTLLVTHTDSYHNFSISGGVLESIRNTALNVELITLLRSRPYNITRLDVAIDIPTPGYLTISNLRANHPDGTCSISGHPRNITYVTSQDPFNPSRETGTAYFQSKSYRGYVKLRVYDKINELFSSGKGDNLEFHLSGKFLTRYEFSVCKGASLDDFSRPDNVFWHYMPSTILKRPESVSVTPWSPVDRVEYDSLDDLHITDYERLRTVLEQSVSLRLMVQNASRVNGGISLLHRLIDSHVSDDDFA